MEHPGRSARRDAWALKRVAAPRQRLSVADKHTASASDVVRPLLFDGPSTADTLSERSATLASMTAAAKKLLSAALKLKPQERFALAEQLLGAPDEQASLKEVEGAWKAELERRADGIEAGGPRGDEWPAVEKRIRARLKKRG